MSDSVWPHDGSPLGSIVPGIFQARTLERVAISFSNAWKCKVKVKSLSRVWLLATPWTATHQVPPFLGFSRQEYWSGLPYRLDLMWYLMVCLGNRDHSVIFEIAFKYCILDSFVDSEGYSISSEGFLLTVVDVMFIWVKVTHSNPFLYRLYWQDWELRKSAWLEPQILSKETWSPGAHEDWASSWHFQIKYKESPEGILFCTDNGRDCCCCC